MNKFFHELFASVTGQMEIMGFVKPKYKKFITTDTILGKKTKQTSLNNLFQTFSKCYRRDWEGGSL